MACLKLKGAKICPSPKLVPYYYVYNILSNISQCYFFDCRKVLSEFFNIYFFLFSFSTNLIKMPDIDAVFFFKNNLLLVCNSSVTYY